MAIRITDKQRDVHVTQSELAKYAIAYAEAYAHYYGNAPTLEEFINGKRTKNQKISYTIFNDPKNYLCGCGVCTAYKRHESDCAVHNITAQKRVPCDCIASIKY